MSTMRYALVANGADDRSQIEAYMPGNYEVVRPVNNDLLIRGVDNSGWTLDDYVIPRLSSGLHFAREVRAQVVTVPYSEAAMHTKIAGTEALAIEEDRFINGHEIPAAERRGCGVLVDGTDTPIWVLKSEAGWVE